MIALVQRVRRARVEVGGQTVGEIGHGLLVFVCAEPQDDEGHAAKLVTKLLKLRIFADDAGKMNRSVQAVAGGLLIVSQFTLRPTPAPAIARASSVPRRRNSAGHSTSACWPWRANRTRWWPPASSVPTCRCTWSTMAR